MQKDAHGTLARRGVDCASGAGESGRDDALAAVCNDSLPYRGRAAFLAIASAATPAPVGPGMTRNRENRDRPGFEILWKPGLSRFLDGGSERLRAR